MIATSRNLFIITLLKMDYNTRGRPIYWMSLLAILQSEFSVIVDGNNFRGACVPY
jgi:hypothetical protein